MTESRSRPEPPLAAAQEAKVAILKTADAVRRRAAALLAGRGITFQQYNVLRILRGAKAGPLATAQLAQRTIEVIADLDGLLEDLERKQLVRRASAETGPNALWSATPAALDLLGPLDGPVADGDLAAVGDLGEAEVRALIALLGRVRARI